MTSKTWSVQQIQCIPSIDGKDNVVYVVNWLLTGERDGYTAQIYNIANIEYDPNSQYTEYSKLTADQVLGWVKASLGDEQVRNIELQLEDELDKKAAPQLVSPNLPWVDQTYVPIKLY